MVSVVCDDGSGDPLHERCDESDVYEGEVAQLDMVPELDPYSNGGVLRARALVIKSLGILLLPSFAFIIHINMIASRE